MDIIAGINLVKSFLQALNGAKSAIETADIKLKLSEVLTLLENAESELAKKDEKIRGLEHKLLEQSKNAIKEFKDGVYIFPGKQGEYCPNCFDNSGGYERLSIRRAGGILTVKNCNKTGCGYTWSK